MSTLWVCDTSYIQQPPTLLHSALPVLAKQPTCHLQQYSIPNGGSPASRSNLQTRVSDHVMPISNLPLASSLIHQLLSVSFVQLGPGHVTLCFEQSQYVSVLFSSQICVCTSPIQASQPDIRHLLKFTPVFTLCSPILNIQKQTQTHTLIMHFV